MEKSAYWVKYPCRCRLVDHISRQFHEKNVDLACAVVTALQAHSDGLYRVFIDDVEVAVLSDVAPLHENSRIAFIRFTFLAGRMW